MTEEEKQETQVAEETKEEEKKEEKKEEAKEDEEKKDSEESPSSPNKLFGATIYGFKSKKWSNGFAWGIIMGILIMSLIWLTTFI